MNDYATQYLGKIVSVKVDRPLGSKHPKFNYHYDVNYGYVPQTEAPDGEEVDAYVLGPTGALNDFSGECIAVIHRFDDEDDKLIVVAKGSNFSDEEIAKQVNFQEKYFTSKIIRTK